MSDAPPEARALLSRRVLISCAPLALARTANAQPVPVRVYAAMTFRAALDEVLSSYRESGGSASAVYGPTPILVRQLAGGAPADILLTADPDWMDEAARRSLIQPETRSNLLSNSLVLAGSRDVRPVGDITRTFDLQGLLRGGRLAMCDPTNDPAGRYAKQSLQALGFWDAVAARVAIAESAPGAVVMVDRGEAPAAVCFKTDLRGDDYAAIIGTFPSSSHAPIVYPVALTKDASNPRAEQALAFLHTAKALRVFASFGYETVGQSQRAMTDARTRDQGL